jgi:hypothetical protein
MLRCHLCRMPATVALSPDPGVTAAELENAQLRRELAELRAQMAAIGAPVAAAAAAAAPAPGAGSRDSNPPSRWWICCLCSP